jgi:hypothetical protein
MKKTKKTKSKSKLSQKKLGGTKSKSKKRKSGLLF